MKIQDNAVCSDIKGEQKQLHKNKQTKQKITVLVSVIVQIRCSVY